MKTASRRELLRGASGLALGVALGGCRTPRATGASGAVQATPFPGPGALPEPEAEPAALVKEVEPVEPGPALLPAPDLSDARVLRFVAGLRPYRRGGVRLEADEPAVLDGKLVVHDYGHGGAGITLSLGCAEEVLALVAARVAPPESVRVLGGGVSGLTAARRLAQAGYRVRVLAREWTPDTTSDVAGGQWSPSLVGFGATPDERARFDRVLRASHTAFATLADDAGAAERYGVFRRPNYTTRGAGGGLRDIPAGLFAPPERLARLPFPGRPRAGDRFDTFLIEPPRFLPALMDDLADLGVEIERGEVTTLADVRALPEDVVVNALGLGARELFGDALLQPVRGQLVLLEPQALPYLLSHEGYLFPRTDALVLGGTVERGASDAAPDPARCERILAQHRRFFAS